MRTYKRWWYMVAFMTVCLLVIALVDISIFRIFPWFDFMLVIGSISLIAVLWSSRAQLRREGRW